MLAALRMPRVRSGASTLGAIALTLALMALLVWVFDASPVATLTALWTGITGSPFTIGQTLMIASVLALTGLAACLPFSAKLWNVGGEGQLYIGGTASVTTALLMPGAPAAVVVPASVIAGALGGAAWGTIPGLLRAWAGASEMIISLLLNFVAVLVASYVIREAFPDASGQGTRVISDQAHLPVLWEAGAVNMGLIISVIAVAAAWLLLGYTRWGFAIRAVGMNADAARLAGFRTATLTVATFAVAGAMAGIAGALLVLGTNGQLSTGISSNYGFLGVAVALVAALRPALIPLSAVLFAALSVGSNSLQVAVSLPRELGTVLVAVLIITLLATHVLRVRR